ncbi:MAG: WG repeat-containing protein [Candidatus Saccharibacteria bacterium]
MRRVPYWMALLATILIITASLAGCGQQAVSPTHPDLYPVWAYGKSGFIDRDGQIIIPPTFESASQFSDGLALVSKNGRYGFIDPTGNLVIDYKRRNTGDFHEGLALISDPNQQYFINRQGNVAIKPSGDYFGDFNEGLAFFGLSGKYGYINKSGKQVIKAQFESANKFSESRALVKLNNKYGYIDHSGKLVIPPTFEEGTDFSEGLAAVKVAGKWGFINTDGKMVIKPQFYSISYNSFNSGLLDMKSKTGWGYIDKTGKFAIAPKYQSVQPFKDGYGVVETSKQRLVIDTKGKTLAAFPHEVEVSYENGLLRITQDMRETLKTLQGKTVWSQTSPLELGKGLSLVEKKYKFRRLLAYYPQINGIKDAEISQKINTWIKSQFPMDLPDATTEVDVDYTVDYHRGNLLGVTIDNYMYSDGAAHGLTMRQSFLINLSSGRVYQLQDLFKKDADFTSAVNKIIKHDFATQDYGQIENFVTIKPDDQYYWDNDGFVMYFQLYQFTCYAAGFPEFKIKFDDVKGLIDTNGELWRELNTK